LIQLGPVVKQVGSRGNPHMDPLRQEPRFQAVMKALKFPD
jgi:hypothetical protein